MKFLFSILLLPVLAFSQDTLVDVIVGGNPDVPHRWELHMFRGASPARIDSNYSAAQSGVPLEPSSKKKAPILKHLVGPILQRVTMRNEYVSQEWGVRGRVCNICDGGRAYNQVVKYLTAIDVSSLPFEDEVKYVKRGIALKIIHTPCTHYPDSIYCIDRDYKRVVALKIPVVKPDGIPPWDFQKQ